jgi:hypothetical protein
LELQVKLLRLSFFLVSFALEDALLEELCGGHPPVEEGDRKISLIIELATQLSLQTKKILSIGRSFRGKGKEDSGARN